MASSSTSPEPRRGTRRARSSRRIGRGWLALLWAAAALAGACRHSERSLPDLVTEAALGVPFARRSLLLERGDLRDGMTLAAAERRLGARAWIAQDESGTRAVWYANVLGWHVEPILEARLAEGRLSHWSAGPLDLR